MRLPAPRPGRNVNPLYRIRKLLLAGYERLDERGHDASCSGLRHGDPNDELLGAWLAKESVCDIYFTEDPKEARVLLDKAIIGCKSDEVEEMRSLGQTLERCTWRRRAGGRSWSGWILGSSCDR